MGQALCVFRAGGVVESLGHLNLYRATLISGVVPFFKNFLNKGKIGSTPEIEAGCRLSSFTHPKHTESLNQATQTAQYTFYTS